mgnify:CR=1 FL=1
MDLIVIAQIITGSATLIVALVLVYQLRQQHKDTDIELTMEAMSFLQKQIHAQIVDNDFPELFQKSKFNGIKDLNKFELSKIELWISLETQRIVTEWRLGRQNYRESYYRFQINRLFENKAAIELYDSQLRPITTGMEKVFKKKGLLNIFESSYEENLSKFE